MPKIPGISHAQAVRALRKVGFEVVREGKHTILSNGERIEPGPNHPAGGNAGFTPWFPIGHHSSGAPEPSR